jgi:type I restriction enzyme S subunit
VSDALPSGWAKVTLDDVVEVRDFEREPVNSSERAERLEGKSQSELFPYYGATGQVGWIDDYRSEGEQVLLGEDGAPFLDQNRDKAYIVNGRYWVNNHAHVLRGVKGAMNNRFMAHQLNATDYHEFVTGSTRLKLTSAAMRKIPLLVPPYAEQVRIVEKLEELLSDLDAGVAELKAAQRKLAQYRQSLLKAAVEGALTADWRAANGQPQETGAELLQRILSERRARWEQKQLAKFAEQGKAPPKGWQAKYEDPVGPELRGLPSLPDGWIWASIDQLSFVIRGASPRPAGDPRYFGGDIPWITVGSLTADESMYLDSVDQFVTAAGKDASRYIEPNTLLLTNSGATLGVPKITRIGGCINDGSVALLDVDDCLKTYLYWFLRTQTKRLRALNQGAAQPNLNTDIVRRICVPLAPQDEMNSINDLLDKSVQSMVLQVNSIDRGLKQAAAQRKNLLKAAFSGQLIQQDPNDEPASELLARIRAERASKDSSAPRRRRKTA